MKISASALEAVHKHVVEGYPYEIAGMLLAKKGTRDVIDTRRAKNADTSRPRDTYQIDPL